MIPAIGYGLRKQNRSCAGDPAWTGVEIEFIRASHPLRLAPYLTGLNFEYISIHSLDLSVASPDPPRPEHLDALVEVAHENGAAAISDHLAFTRGGDAGVGHFTSAPFTETALDAVCRNIDRIQKHFGEVAFFLENLAHIFRLKGTMPEPVFLRRLLERTGCGWLCDVTNIYYNHLNFGDDPLAFLREVMPAAGRVQMHLSGGFFEKESGKYVDTHSEPIPEAVWDLYRQALELGRGKVEGVFIEREDNFPEEEGWLGEVRRARRIAEEVVAQP
jgi:uncharacterized protein (UPF0276 family)